MKSRSKLTVTSLDLTICAVYVAVFKLYLIPDIVQNILKIGLLLCVIIFLITHVKLNEFLNASFILVLPIIISATYNYLMSRNSQQEFLNGVLYAICLYCLYTIILYWAKRGRIASLIKDVYFITMVYVVVSIISILILGRNATTYIFGSKFFTCYYFIFFIGLYYFRHYKNNASRLVNYLVLCGILIFFAWYIRCTTGLIALLFVLVFSFMTEPIKRPLSNPVLILIFVFVSLLSMFGIAEIVQNRFVQYIITAIFHKSPNLSDRLRYYGRAVNVFRQGNVLFGYGYDSSRMSNAIGLGSNIQNGFMQYILNYGILGGLTCLYTIYRSVKRQVKVIGNKWGFYIIIYAFLLCAVVEVSFNTVFFFTLFLIYWINYSENKIKE